MEQLPISGLKQISTKLDRLSRADLINENQVLESELSRAVKEIYRLKYAHLTEEQLNLILAAHLSEMQSSLYGASSERYKKPEDKPKKQEPPKPRIKQPSERYPNIPVREIPIELSPQPSCGVCGNQMSDSGMTEDSEQLTMVPKKFEILRYKRSIYRCSCQSCMVTAPAVAKIIPSSSYSNEMILDVALSKYCDLIPIERYVGMARRSGLMDLPPHSLIDLTHKFAVFVKDAYHLIEAGVLKARVMSADETPHRMLEGSDKKSWYLWGFSTSQFCFLDARGTRSGDVPKEMLLKSRCEVLLTDDYSGYDKAIRLTNIERRLTSQKLIVNAKCNAHSRRYFYKPRLNYPEADFYLDHYHEIYQLESEAKGKPPNEVLKLRSQMKSRFEAMKTRACEELRRYPDSNQYKRGLNYYIENYEGLTLFLTEADVPIDNNSQERLLRSHVVGRKTWYGTHSEQGAKTAAVLFSIVETCKLNGVNPREYFPKLVEDLLNGKSAYTPSDFKNFAQS